MPFLHGPGLKYSHPVSLAVLERNIEPDAWNLHGLPEQPAACRSDLLHGLFDIIDRDDHRRAGGLRGRFPRVEPAVDGAGRLDHFPSVLFKPKFNTYPNFLSVNAYYITKIN